ncbi:MAG TPA: tRNA (adenosine(37)-N6)-dimethylallyltransferase MiaA [Acidimicrobiales bacterium]|nr:tRNA (adenosine(37)-N6)-dimethylallyltransferase MiaA [Acidimicrobiales bacterium]
MPSAEIDDIGAGEIRHLALVGPTASGKTEIAIAVAKELGDVEIVVADAMCVYRRMDIGTAKPTRAQQAEVPHHLLDLADPSEDFSIGRLQRTAAEVVQQIEARERRALVVGGSGLYVRAIVDGYAPPPQYAEARAELEEEADTERLHARLAELDPVAASRMEPNNRRRVLRALEVTVGSGTPFSQHGAAVSDYPPSRFRQAGIWTPREVLAQRIEQRYAAQMQEGFLDEVRALRDLDPPMSRTAAQGLGYRELLAHLGGVTSLEDALESAISRTRAFARRQRVWFRRDPRITWLGSSGDPQSLVPALLGDWERQ